MTVTESNLFRKDVAKYQKRKIAGSVILVQPVSSTVLVLFACLVIIAVTALAATHTYTRKETAVGYLAPVDGLREIRGERIGRIQTVWVKEGSVVEVGDPLFETRLDLETREGFVNQRLSESLQARLEVLKNTATTVEMRFRDENKRLSVALTNLDQRQESLTRRKDIHKQLVDASEELFMRMSELLDKEVTSPIEVDNAKSKYLRDVSELESVQEQVSVLKAQRSSLAFEKSGLVARKSEELAKVNGEIFRLEEQLVEISGQSSLVTTAPIAGTISALNVRVGQMIDPASNVAVIIPEDATLEAILLVPTRYSGFLQNGQKVNLLIDAFPYQRFGAQKSTITEISKTPISSQDAGYALQLEGSVYKVRASMEQQSLIAYGDKLELKPGMTFTGDIIIDERSLLAWLFEPLFTLNRM